MGISQKDIKLLWGRAANRCAICRVELSQDASAKNASFVLGEQAHIVGETGASPRGESPLSPEDRNSYHNLILLCPTHHREVDKNVIDWPVERLYLAKSAHELWVSESLGIPYDAKQEAANLAVTSVIDAAVDLCNLTEWNRWVSDAYGYDASRPLRGFDFFGFRARVAATVWPEKFSELRRSAFTLSILLLEYDNAFMEHADTKGDRYIADKFYRSQVFNPNYDNDVRLYREWISKFSSLLIDSTKAANWFADVVRRDVNPMFFAEYGKFRVYEGMGVDLKNYMVVPEYNDKEKSELPDALVDEAT